MSQERGKESEIDWKKVASISQLAVMLALLLAVAIGLVGEIIHPTSQDNLMAAVEGNGARPGGLK